MGTFVSDNSKYAGDPKRQGAPKPGTRYNPPAPSKDPGQAKHNDTPGMDEWLKPWPKGGPDSGGQFFKPGPGPR